MFWFTSGRTRGAQERVSGTTDDRGARGPQSAEEEDPLVEDRVDIREFDWISSHRSVRMSWSVIRRKSLSHFPRCDSLHRRA